jgi:hypothetical protein
MITNSFPIISDLMFENLHLKDTTIRNGGPLGGPEASGAGRRVGDALQRAGNIPSMAP